MPISYAAFPDDEALVISPSRDYVVSAEVDEDEGLVTIDSPMVGVFYSAPAPGENPFLLSRRL